MKLNSTLRARANRGSFSLSARRYSPLTRNNSKGPLAGSARSPSLSGWKKPSGKLVT